MDLSPLHLAGSIAVLLWGSYMLRSAVERAFSTELRKLIIAATASRFHALICGAVAAVVMQSATATILLTASFIGSGLLSLPLAVVIILGADAGSALAVRLLFFDWSILSPLCLCGGISLHLLSRPWRWRQFGRVLIGLGLILLSIRLMRQQILPLSSSAAASDLLLALSAVPWLCMLATALLTWLAHSSIAVLLVAGTLAQTGLIPPQLAVPMLLGANIGAGLIAWPLVDRRQLDIHAAVLTNLLLRSALAVTALLLLERILPHIGLLSRQPGEQIIYLHLLFNGLLALLCTPFAGSIAGPVKRFIESRQPADNRLSIDPGSGLDAAHIDHPTLALSSSRREAMRLADNTESLFARALSMFEAGDRAEIDRLAALDQEINARNKAIQRYLSEARRHIREHRQEQQLDEILQFATCMENIGDSVAYDLARLANKRLGRQVRLSSKGRDELALIHAELLSLLQLTVNDFALGQAAGIELTKTKIDTIEQQCEASISNHRLRLSDRRAESLSSSSIHQDTVRSFLQVLSYIKNCRYPAPPDAPAT